ncbi:MAG: hypothetical protein M3Q68_08960, partial [Actinomycetota bacterium]|nr:hypothetical protein [Actinomycetota bacterium]
LRNIAGGAEAANQKLMSGLVGETEALRSLGVVISEADVKRKAYTLGIAREGAELNEAQKIQARYALIMEQTGKAQGDFARTSDSLANQQRILQAQFENVQAQVGEGLIPTVQDLGAAFTGLFAILDGLSKPIGGLGSLIEAAATAINPVVLLGQAVQQFKEITGDAEPTVEELAKTLELEQSAASKAAAAMAEVTKETKRQKDAAAALTKEQESRRGAVLSSIAATAGVRDAEQRLEDARRGVAEAGDLAKQKERDLADARESVTDAVREVTRAEEDLTDARREAPRQLRDAHLDARDAALSVRQAERDLAEARTEAGDAAAEASAEAAKALTPLQRAQAALNDTRKDIDPDAVARAEINLERAQIRQIEAAERAAELEREREHPRVVAEAEDRLADAKDKVADAQRGVNEVQARDNSKAVREANDDLADASTGVAGAYESQRTALLKLNELGLAAIPTFQTITDLLSFLDKVGSAPAASSFDTTRGANGAGSSTAPAPTPTRAQVDPSYQAQGGTTFQVENLTVTSNSPDAVQVANEVAAAFAASAAIAARVN